MKTELAKKYPIIEDMMNGEEVFWVNPAPEDGLSPEVTEGDVADAADRLGRFAPYIMKAFPETEGSKGIIESPVKEIPVMKEYLEQTGGFETRGRLLLKCDNLLPVSGSIKARGGIYEVLALAERLALEHGLITKDGDYSVLDGDKAEELFSRYEVAVGSTGNLGLSIGIISAKLGFRVSVHMSSDARQWKKDMLRGKGAEVIEYDGDYQKAVAEGRRLAESNPLCHFVDDENSRELFMGYAVAGRRLKAQLDAMGVTVDADHPLLVYLPCGVGGGPGGVAYGIKQVYGKHAHCVFAEPTEAPCMLLGVLTGLHDGICVQDIGLSGKTIADGLAVSRASKFVGRVVGNMLDGLYTVEDNALEPMLRALYKLEGIFVEPSAAAGLPGYVNVSKSELFGNLDGATHIVWATGGGMVPQKDRDAMLGVN